MKKGILVVIAILFLFSSMAFGAVIKKELSEFTAEADLIVVGEVKKIESRWNPGETIFTYVTIATEQFLKGSAGKEVTLRFPGGEVGGIGLKVSDTPNFKLGEKVKVFLKGKDIYDIVGLSQGKYTILDEEVFKPISPTYSYSGIHWPGASPMPESIKINPNCADATAGTPGDQISAIKDWAAQYWFSQGNANFKFRYGGTTAKTLPDDGTVGSPNGNNEIMFVQDLNYWYFNNNPSVIAVVWSWYTLPDSHLTECDMAFNDENFIFRSSGQPTSLEMDIWNVAIHEFGHFLLLNDLYGGADAEKTMYGYISGGETKKRYLHADDISGIQYIYGLSLSAVELAFFNAQTNNSSVILDWQTGSELNNAGFNVYRSTSLEGEYTKLNSELIPANANPFEGASYSYTDKEVVSGLTYYYKLEDLSIGGISTFHGPVSAKVSVSVPSNFALAQNYPNPFNASTMISYDLKTDAKVSLKVYNILGQKITTLVDKYQPAGSYTVTWNGKDSKGNDLSTGVYFYILKAGDFSANKKMTYVK